MVTDLSSFNDRFALYDCNLLDVDYLFFDIECANCFGGAGKICEFGYVLTNEKFELLEGDEITIDPNAPFDSYVLLKILTFPKSVYVSSPKFPSFYPKIADLLTRKDRRIFGFETNCDVGYINCDIKRYGLDFLEYEFYDVRKIFASYSGVDRPASLEKLVLSLGYEDDHYCHRAYDDAKATMYALKALCEKDGVGVEELIEKYSIESKKTEKGGISQKTLVKKQLYRVINKKLWVMTKSVKPVGKIIKTPIYGKKVAFNKSFAKSDYKLVMAIIQLLKNRKSEFVFSVKTADIYVDDREKSGEPYEYQPSLKNALDSGANIEIIAFEELLIRMNVTAEDVERLSKTYKDIPSN